MNFKRSWKRENGLTLLYKKEDSACKQLEVDALKLNCKESFSAFTGEKEYGITILSGTCSVSGDGFEYLHIGERENVFDGKAYAVYIPRMKNLNIIAETDLCAIIGKCPSSVDSSPVLVTPDDVIVKNLGKPGFERQAHFLIDERIKADKIYIGENFIRGGQWSSFPGHKHDENRMPDEGFAEEIYYYEFDKPSGYGIQQVYTADRSLDEAYAVRNFDAVEIPKGYHPCCVAPGYNGYLLWVMGCDNRGFFMTIDPEQEWQVK
ncbi:MAG: 5-deoxy-glucuronate isomerase [Clostridia bacterium]|nr:5-deoxy-glucuronate isomerase [Clostridia bacterium]